MLTKELLNSPDFHTIFAALPEGSLWPLERIRESLDETLRARAPDEDVWLFGYGSLIWNPWITFTERRAATLEGWHRSFCLRMVAGRASMDAPGRMLGLEQGGSTQGIAFRLPEAGLEEELLLMWRREMLVGSYLPRWVTVKFADGGEARAIVFSANPERPNFEKDSSVAQIGRLIAAASGPFGSNLEYVLSLEKALAEHGLADEYVAALCAEIRRLGAETAKGESRV